MLDDLLERLPELFDLEDIRSRVDELTPYIMVAIQARAQAALLPTCSEAQVHGMQSLAFACHHCAALETDLDLTQPRGTLALSCMQASARSCMAAEMLCLAQESERMNALLTAMRRSLIELNLGLKGDLTMTEPMEKLTKALANDQARPLWAVLACLQAARGRALMHACMQVPAQWTVLAYPSLRPLSSWLVNLLQRVQQLVDWTADLAVPKSVWISGACSFCVVP